MGVCMSVNVETLQLASGSSKLKKKTVMEMLNAEAKVSQILSKVPGRICANGSASCACAFSKQGRKGINQDTMLVWEDFRSQTNTVFCGVFDGHGPSGHLVARKVRDSLPVLLALPQSLLANEVGDADEAGGELEDSGEDGHKVGESGHGDRKAELHGSSDQPTAAELHGSSDQPTAAAPVRWKDSLVAAHKLMDKNLKSHPKLCCADSGTTAITMVVQEKDLMIGNVGDSRAVLGRRGQDGVLAAHQLTTDLKPNLPGELERIKRCNGRVFALEDEPNVARVWVPDLDMPGLAMARALGDFCLKKYGLSATPQVVHRKLMEEDEFIVLATDGVWDVLSNEEVVRIVASAYPKEEAAKALVHAATRAWKIRHGVWRTDDCTAVCYFIKDKLIPTVPMEACA